jgi:hypothetical protein
VHLPFSETLANSNHSALPSAKGHETQPELLRFSGVTYLLCSAVVIVLLCALPPRLDEHTRGENRSRLRHLSYSL